MIVGLKVEAERRNERDWLRLEGRVDAVSSATLEKQITALIEEGRKHLLLDFAKVEYLSSAGMRLLLSATKKLKARGGGFSLFSMNDEVMQIVKMAGFERILSIFPDEQTALEAVS